jgi:hypothetical protein
MSSSSDGFQMDNKYTIKESSFIPLIILTLTLVFGGAALMSRLEISQIKADWANRRCEPSVLFSSFLYKPDGYPNSAATFAADNFSFCSDTIIENILNQIISMFLTIIGKQSSTSNVIHSIQNTIQSMISNVSSTFVELMDPFYKSYSAGVAQVARITQAIRRSLQRINAIIVAQIYSGISVLYALLNSIDFIVKVVLIILGILLAIVILLFLFFFPVIPMILAVISALVIAGLGAMVGGMAATFCLAENTPVLMADNTVKKIKDLHIGDILAGNGVVEGLYEFNGASTEMYDISGIHVSADHLIWYGDSWITVNMCPVAKITPAKYSRIYCPVISNRCIPVLSPGSSVIWFRDWEELSPTDITGYSLYHSACNNILNNYKPISHYEPHNDPVVSPHIKVLKYSTNKNSYCSISDISIGDFVYSDTMKDYVHVIGIYKTPICGGYNNWISDGIWIKQRNDWVHPTEHNCNIEINNKIYDTSDIGYNLIVEGGEFTIYNNDNKYNIRDALEIGKKINLTYNLVTSRIQKEYPPF